MSAFLLDTFGKLLAALPLTLEVWALSMLVGGAVAAGVTWARLAGGPVGAAFGRAYVFVFRGAPLLVQLFFVYYGLASIGAVRTSVFWPFLRDAFDCAVLALSLCTAAYQSEIFRGA
ncbi:MAG: ABC transporter permease subunit, partial [Hyphomicrobiales bacterium]|nr:ABC transporter permease subunit [Hyphomicrobiales bacterium]